jgi:hypothetical protein
MSDTGVTVERTVTVTELAYCSGSSIAAIRAMLAHDLLSPVAPGPVARFPADAVERVRKIHRISMELDVDFPAMNLVLDLMNRIERLERQAGKRGP